jgi:hypothetical protein
MEPQLGPHAIGTERFPTVSSGSSFTQVAGVILGKQARVQNPDKDEFIHEAPWSTSVAKTLPRVASQRPRPPQR